MNSQIFIPKEEVETIEKLYDDCFLMALELIPIPPPPPLNECFFFVNCYPPYGICMERKSDQQIFEMSEVGVADLQKPVDRQYFKRYSRGMDL